MALNLKGRSFLTLEDFTPGEIRYLLDLGHDLKAKRRSGVCEPALKGKHIVLLFEKASTRTRPSCPAALGVIFSPVPPQQSRSKWRRWTRISRTSR